MKRIRSLLLIALGCALAALAVAGCTDSHAGPASGGTGTVKVLMASPATPALSGAFQLPLTQLDLVKGTAGTTSGSLDPSLIVPLIDQQLVLQFIPSVNPQNIEAAVAQIPAGVYSQIRLVLGQVNLQGIGNLPFDPSTLPTMIPITGGLQVNGDQVVTLLVNLVNGTATVVPGP